MHRMHPFRLVRLLICMSSLSFLCAPGVPARAAAFPKAPVRYDWVCVTDAPMVAEYETLAAHRRGQGLAAVVLPLDEVIRWSPAGDDTVATLRWLATLAHEQWQARYLVLGGSHALLPAPIHRLTASGYDWDNPTDAYYRCLAGDWDVDGDGLFAEYGEDAADPTVHIGLGRLPVDTPAEAAALVAKILAFESRPEEQTGGALFISSLGSPFWDGSPYPTPFLGLAMGLHDLALAVRPDLRTSTLYQGPEVVDPWNDPLNPVSLVASLAAPGHDLVHVQLMCIPQAWELVQTQTVRSDDLDGVAGSGNLFIGTMGGGIAADTREPGILQHLLTMPDGGAAAMVAPSGMGYLAAGDVFQRRLWTRLLDGSCERLGEAFDGALDGYFADIYEGPATYDTYWTFCLLGDPATLLASTASLAATAAPEARAVDVRGVPNPFNPQTEIRFEVVGPGDRAQPVRVEIFDLKGRLVEVLLDRELRPGPRRLLWRPDRASGLYCVRVTVAGRRSTAKLTLLK